MRMSWWNGSLVAPLAVLRVALWVILMGLAGCERPPVDVVQRGYRGTGMDHLSNPRHAETLRAANTPPEADPPSRVRANAPRAGDVYQNVQVLRDLSIGEFGRTMNAMTNWVAPQQSCAYCHAEGNFADDSKYTKVVARRMLQMTQKINTQWTSHVGSTGVTCYTCHRGQNVPAERWFLPVAPSTSPFFVNYRAGQNRPGPSVGMTSLPDEVFRLFLLDEAGAAPVRVVAPQALPSTPGAPIPRAEATYGLMIHLSKSLGVNCTFCHNARSFASWGDSSPQRLTAWHGLRMVRDVNSHVLSPLSGVFPEIPVGRLGPGKDAAKVNCATCHQGVHKPLYGAPMARNYPALLLYPAGPTALSAAEAASAVALGTAAGAVSRP